MKRHAAKEAENSLAVSTRVVDVCPLSVHFECIAALLVRAVVNIFDRADCTVEEAILEFLEHFWS